MFRYIIIIIYEVPTHVRGFTAGQKDCGKSGLGHRAAGPPGRGPMGLRAAGPLGRGGPWAAGRWAAGLLLAKPGGTVVPRESDANLEGNSNSIC